MTRRNFVNSAIALPLPLVYQRVGHADWVGDTPRNWAGEAQVWRWSSGPPLKAPCRVVELGGPGYWNRWGVVLEGEYPQLVQPRTASWIKCQEEGAGPSEYYTVMNWGEMEIFPTDPNIQAAIRQAAAQPLAFETRPQNVTVYLWPPYYATMGLKPAGRLRTCILFDEPWAETDGRATPSPEWQTRFQQDVITWGGAHQQTR